MKDNGLYIQLFSPHGLIRGNNPEIGRDPDTGGQVRYVLELLKALGNHPKVRKVELFTRYIKDKRVSPQYSVSKEEISDKAAIIRIQCGGKEYRRKETLWQYLDEFIDKTIRFIRNQKDIPDICHGHYADGCYIAFHLSVLFGIPFLVTGHSLGRNKMKILSESGMTAADIEKRFNMKRRINVEETVLRNADFVITSTQYEIETQYNLYESKDIPEYMVLPPGINTEIFYPYYASSLPGREENIGQEQAMNRVSQEIERFLYEPNKPLILMVARPDKRKNFELMLEAYGGDLELRQIANMAIFAGIRKDIAQMPENEQEVLTNLLLLMDKFDLYGKLAIPKKNNPENEIPAIYRLAAWRKGVFVNPTPGENFGLSLIEAATSGLPIIASPDGGPREIIDNCGNGEFIDLKDVKNIANVLKKILINSELWQRYSDNGIKGVNDHYIWKVHVDCYIERITDLVGKRYTNSLDIGSNTDIPIGKRLFKVKNFFITDIDGTLIGEQNPHLEDLISVINGKRENLVFGVSTGRNHELTLEVLRQHKLPEPDIVICSVGTEIYYGANLVQDKGWRQHISHKWKREKIEKLLKNINGIVIQEPEAQKEFKISYYATDQFTNDTLANIHQKLYENNLSANAVLSEGKYIDFIPYRAGKGKAVRYLSYKWNTPLENFITCGNSGNDVDMLKGSIKGIVVGNHSPELEFLRKSKRIYFAKSSLAGGILEGLQHYVPFEGNGNPGNKVS